MITLAFADDNKFNRALLKSYVKRTAKFELLISSLNGIDLLDKLVSANNIPAICILDIQMPEMDGIETARILRIKYPQLELFGFTSCCNPFYTNQMLTNGVIRVFAKTELMLMFDFIVSWVDNKRLLNSSNCMYYPKNS